MSHCRSSAAECREEPELAVFTGREKNILIVDNDEIFRFRLWRHIVKMNRNFYVFMAENAEQARAILTSIPMDLVISDLEIPSLEGLEVAGWLAENQPRVRAILMGSRAVPEFLSAIKDQGFVFLRKPLDLGAFFSTVSSLLADGADVDAMPRRRSGFIPDEKGPEGHPTS